MRGLGEGLGPDTRIGDVTTPGVHYCFDDEELDAASEKMNVQKVRRLPVVNRDKRLVGMISLGSLLGRVVTIGSLRGRLQTLAEGAGLLVTQHPSRVAAAARMGP